MLGMSIFAIPIGSTAVAVLSRPPATEPCACDMVGAAAVTPHLR